MPNQILYRGYCWSIGTTSFRTKNFNRNIELQLELLSEFRSLPENIGVDWRGNNIFQIAYYNFLKNNGFIIGNAENPAKDAREKTSGLVDLGLINDNRELVEPGKILLDLAQRQDFASDNILEIDKDSFIYFKQLLKTSVTVDGNVVRPFVVILLLLSKLKYLTYDEFRYLAPMCINADITKYVIGVIEKSRADNKEIYYDGVLLDILMKMSNYQAALVKLQKHEVTEELICRIGMNRKSPKYDKNFFGVYKTLEKIILYGEPDYLELKAAIAKTNTKTLWNKYCFVNSSSNYIKKNGQKALCDIPIFHVKNEEQLKVEFFKLLHLIKAKSTLSDYFDLNRRYIKATDTVIFADENVQLDILPMCYLKNKRSALENIAFSASSNLKQDIDLEEIHPLLKLDKNELYTNLGMVLGTNIENSQDAKTQIDKERYERFNNLLNEKFTKEKLIILLDKFKIRDDETILSMVTDNADIPTIFEYILAISWYVISGRCGDVLHFMNLSLEADLLPKTHAGGGEADIVWQYDESVAYPEHTLLIEATLADSSNQRRMEMEPVSRHLGEYLLDNPEKNAYCVFISTYLDNNVISDFRGRRFIEYYNRAGDKWVEGMNISPMDIDLLILLLKADVKYPFVYNILHKAYNSDVKPALKWYHEKIENSLREMI